MTKFFSLSLSQAIKQDLLKHCQLEQIAFFPPKFCTISLSDNLLDILVYPLCWHTHDMWDSFGIIKAVGSFAWRHAVTQQRTNLLIVERGLLKKACLFVLPDKASISIQNFLTRIFVTPISVLRDAFSIESWAAHRPPFKIASFAPLTFHTSSQTTGKRCKKAAASSHVIVKRVKTRCAMAQRDAAGRSEKHRKKS